MQSFIPLGSCSPLVTLLVLACGCSASHETASPEKAALADAGPVDAAVEASPYARTSTGCGQGTSCSPGTDLPVPSPDQGIQIETPDNAIVVQPGQEAFLCFYRTLPITANIEVGKFQSWMTPGSSHHFIAYQVGTSAFFPTQADGTIQTCAFGGGTWMYATSTPGQIIENKFPDGVALPIQTGTQVMLNMHFINPSSTPAYPKVKMNLVFAQNVQYQAAAMTSFNRSIDIPAAKSSGPGKQTVSGTCTPPVGSHFFVMTTHTHSRGVDSNVNYVTSAGTTNLVHTTDWEHPDVALWGAPDFLTVGQGDSFTYSCAYENKTSSPITVGDTAATNEMCMAIGYFYPAASGFFCN